MKIDVLIMFTSVDSTMNAAKELSKMISPPFVVVSETQSKSFGQANRKWHSPEGGLWFTEVIEFSQKTPLSLFISIVLLLTLKKYSKDVKVKWPNDIYLKGRKLAGILTHTSNNKAMIGIGINVENKIPEEISDIAISLKSESRIKKEVLLKEIIKNEEKYLPEFLSYGFSPFVKMYNKNLLFLNRKITVQSKDTVEGRALGVNKNGALLIYTENGIKSIFSGTVTNF